MESEGSLKVKGGIRGGDQSDLMCRRPSLPSPERVEGGAEESRGF